MTQLPLPIDWRSSGRRGSEGQDAVVIGEGNRDALALLERPAFWPSHCMLLIGPPRSGRSTIAADIARRGLAEVIDDADQEEETALFHRWNSARENSRSLLLVANEAPPTWAIALPDLRSRLSAAGIARIGPPDEAMIEAMIAQGLGQAGTAFGADVPRYLAPRLARCYQQVEAAVTALVTESLSSGRRISLQRAKDVLAEAVLEGNHLLSSED
ncbi:DnaA regulatory inactivator HdaA [soil metagenome]